MTSHLNHGKEVIKGYVKTLDASPGVYRMLNKNQQVLYVGKAKNLNKRVASYTREQGLPNRTLRMIAQTETMEFVTTSNETEALLLEANLIKRYAPPFNILLRDDKSFPYILIDQTHPFPRILKYRGERNIKGEYYGPFASSSAVNESMTELQKAFLLRSCSDSVFSNRSRPCLLYHIKRCSAPCVGKISSDNYQNLVKETASFFKGKDQSLLKKLKEKMLDASDKLEFEHAAHFRNRMTAITKIQHNQTIALSHAQDIDVFGTYTYQGKTAIQVFFFRGGRNFGSCSYFPKHEKDDSLNDILTSFLPQFYESRPVPRHIFLSCPLDKDAKNLLEDALSSVMSYKIKITVPLKGEHKKIIDHAVNNAKEALRRQSLESASQQAHLQALQDLFNLEAPPKRIEVYDNSHIMGESAVGAMIVAGPEGFLKNQYRKFTIKDKTTKPGDDYGMMREVFTRRFSKELKSNKDQLVLPDLIIVDGGKGQLNVACQILADLGLDDLKIIGIAKGEFRNAGDETFYLKDQSVIKLDKKDPNLYFIQRLRDEAHRFAIATHRHLRDKKITKSALDHISGIGPKRKKALILHFGSIRELSGASIENIMQVNGINFKNAVTIYNYFHDKREPD